MAKRLPRRLGGRSRGDLKRAHSQHWACEATECGEGGGTAWPWQSASGCRSVTRALLALQDIVWVSASFLCSKCTYVFIVGYMQTRFKLICVWVSYLYLFLLLKRKTMAKYTWVHIYINQMMRLQRILKILIYMIYLK